MSNFNPPKRFESFQDVLDVYLYLYVSHNFLPEEYGRAVWEANPHGFSYDSSYRETLTDLLIAFAVKERQ